MADQKKPPAKKSGSLFGEILDGAAWVVRQAALPIPDIDLKKKKKPDPKRK